MLKQFVIVFVGVFFLLSTITARCQDKQGLLSRIRLLLDDSTLEQAIVALEVRDVNSNQNIISINAHKSMVPASIQKLITTGCSMALLDSAYTFATSVGYTGYIDSCGTLHGNLVVHGSGDPTMGSMYFDEKRPQTAFLSDWAYVVKRYGISSIDGNIIITSWHFENWPVVETWTYEDLGNYYGAGIYSVTIFDNICELHFSSPSTVGQRASFRYSWPQLDGLRLVNQVVAGRGGDNAFVFQSPTSDKMIVRGDITAGRRDFVVKACIPDPPIVFGKMLSRVLDTVGINQTGKIQVVDTDDNMDTSEYCEIFVHQSPSLAQIVNQTNRHSVNLFAEHLLRETGWCTGEQGSTQGGISAVYSCLKDMGIATTGVSIVDGSGLSRFNLVTARFMVDFLTYFHTSSPYSSSFVQSLPVAGYSGTLENFGKKSVLVGNVMAKTGSMTRVKNLAGYLRTRSGKTLAFAFIANNYCCGGARVKAIQEDMLKILYEY